MTLALFGATGTTGQLFLKSALDQGHSVQALARTPEKLTFQHANLSLIQGDARDSQTVDRVIEPADLVISFLGVNPKSGNRVFTQSLETLFASMKKYGKKRIILTAGAGIGDPKDKNSFMGSMVTGIIRLIAPKAYEDGLQAGAFVRSQQAIDWTMIRIPRLTDEPGVQDISRLRVGYLGVGTGFSLSRQDLATYILSIMETQNHIHEAPVISN